MFKDTIFHPAGFLGEGSIPSFVFLKWTPFQMVGESTWQKFNTTTSQQKYHTTKKQLRPHYQTSTCNIPSSMPHSTNPSWMLQQFHLRFSTMGHLLLEPVSRWWGGLVNDFCHGGGWGVLCIDRYFFLHQYSQYCSTPRLNPVELCGRLV